MRKGENGVNRRFCPDCGERSYSSRSGEEWDCPYCGKDLGEVPNEPKPWRYTSSQSKPESIRVNLVKEVFKWPSRPLALFFGIGIAIANCGMIPGTYSIMRSQDTMNTMQFRASDTFVVPETIIPPILPEEMTAIEEVPIEEVQEELEPVEGTLDEEVEEAVEGPVDSQEGLDPGDGIPDEEEAVEEPVEGEEGLGSGDSIPDEEEAVEEPAEGEEGLDLGDSIPDEAVEEPVDSQEGSELSDGSPEEPGDNVDDTVDQDTESQEDLESSQGSLEESGINGEE